MSLLNRVKSLSRKLAKINSKKDIIFTLDSNEIDLSKTDIIYVHMKI